MTKLRTVIVGESGFVGGHLSRAVLASPDLVLVDFVDPLDGNKVDLRHSQAVSRAVAHARPDILFHLAGIAAPRLANDQPLMAWQTNVMGTAHLAYAVLNHAPQAHFIWAGSSEAYGDAFNRSPHPVDESVQLRPLSSYGATKASSDIMLRQMACLGLRSTVLRPFNHTGAGQSDAYVVPAFAKQIALIEKGFQEPVLKIGNLSASRDFLDIEDVISAYMTIARQDEIDPGAAYNLSTGQPVKIQEILDSLRGMSSAVFEVRTDEHRYAASLTPVTSGNPGRAYSDFGWKATTPFSETLAKVMNYWREKL